MSREDISIPSGKREVILFSHRETFSKRSFNDFQNIFNCIHARGRAVFVIELKTSFMTVVEKYAKHKQRSQH